MKLGPIMAPLLQNQSSLGNNGINTAFRGIYAASEAVSSPL